MTGSAIEEHTEITEIVWVKRADAEAERKAAGRRLLKCQVYTTGVYIEAVLIDKQVKRKDRSLFKRIPVGG